MQEEVWLELNISGEGVSGEGVSYERFSELAALVGGEGVVSETDADSGVTRHVTYLHCQEDRLLLENRVLLLLASEGVNPTTAQITLLNQDWESEWQKYWQGVAVGEKFWVRPTFRPAPNDGRIDIVLDPGMAFGTGTHATTQLCMQGLETALTELPGATLLDMGCGSGILAIAAAKLGAEGIVAVDNDPLCTTASEANARLNNVTLDVRLGSQPPAQVFDVVVANILAAPLITLANTIVQSTGKLLLLSGLLVTQANDVRTAYEQRGMVQRTMLVQGDWAMLLFERG